ncbi:hypothetical protein E1B28_004185 [Marasmius oreades]|uniref:CID domain-containing protein n=1 Tax=Marasmius oreades TaxID=181124 RepID=A0A9P7UY27_9AGAR|nr:uncharacterized protein E1B28_004185 [Marasmius oreades]KAG7096775.1 hypothetical protein E1B28_004185 [Marasmius oreades]
MSLYPQPPQPYYNQQPYGASSSYAQQPAPNNFHNFHYPPPVPPPPVYYVDPATLRRDFSQRLSELTVNSRPIIQSLSMFAHDYVRFAEIIAQCLEAHIRRVPPWMKLPAFYLLDMVSKNIYEPYARHFASFVIPLFIETYQQVDEPTRSKMIELVLTWRTGSPAGKELFGVPPQVSIERSIWGDGSNNTRFNSTAQVTKAQVLSELEFTLGQKERALQANSADSIAQHHVAVLQQLRRLVEAGVSQEELHQILGQLRSLMRTVTQPSPPPPPPVAVPPSWTPPAPFPSSAALVPPTQSIVTTPKVEPTSSISHLSLPTAAPAAGFADLLSSLMKSGVVSVNGTPVGAGSTVTEQASSSSVDVEREASRSYRTAIFNHEVQLSTVGLTRSRPAIQSLLYDKLALQCKQCGIRFFDTATGKKELEDHLDMHFRQNLKATQNIGRGHSRSWFIGADDWIHDVSDVKGKGRADFRPLNSKAAAVAETSKREAELRSQFVVVPPGGEATTISCPVCKEILNSEFVEDDEEWVWKNAIRKDDRIYHATCHAEVSSTLVARLRTDVASRSRSGTPERVSHPKQQTPPRGISSSDAKLNGIKRKVDDENSLLSEPEGTPQLKKIALAPASS